MSARPEYDEIWHALLTGTHPLLRRHRKLYRRLPSDPRCKLCSAPFGGVGRIAGRVFNYRQSNLSPSYCNVCDDAARNWPGGAEVQVCVLFADVRGSTSLAEELGAAQFRRLMDRFFRVAAGALGHSDGLLEKFHGDQVTAVYLPGFIGDGYVHAAVDAGQEILRVTGHGTPDGPWIPVGVGIHAGVAYVGMVGPDTVTQFTVLGDTANVGARLASQAGAGEILISESAVEAASLPSSEDLEQRHLTLKGRGEPLDVRVLRVSAQSS